MRKLKILFLFLFVLIFFGLLYLFNNLNFSITPSRKSPQTEPFNFQITAYSNEGIIYANDRPLPVSAIHNLRLDSEVWIKTDENASLEFIHEGIFFLCLPESALQYTPQTRQLFLQKGVFFWKNQMTQKKTGISIFKPENVIYPSSSGKLEIDSSGIQIWNYEGPLSYNIHSTQYRLQPQNYFNSRFSNRSQIQPISPAPESISPEHEIIHFTEKDKAQVRFTWKNVAGANLYLFRIFSSPMKEQILFSQLVENNSVNIDILPYVERGYLYWDVCAYNASLELPSIPSMLGYVQLTGSFYAQKASAKPPDLTLFPFTISGNMVVIKGTATPGCQLYIDGNPVKIDPDGSFIWTIFYPSMGIKEIVFNLVSPTGLTTTVKRRVSVSDISI